MLHSKPPTSSRRASTNGVDRDWVDESIYRQLRIQYGRVERRAQTLISRKTPCPRRVDRKHAGNDPSAPDPPESNSDHLPVSKSRGDGCAARNRIRYLMAVGAPLSVHQSEVPRPIPSPATRMSVVEGGDPSMNDGILRDLPRPCRRRPSAIISSQYVWVAGHLRSAGFPSGREGQDCLKGRSPPTPAIDFEFHAPLRANGKAHQTIVSRSPGKSLQTTDSGTFRCFGRPREDFALFGASLRGPRVVNCRSSRASSIANHHDCGERTSTGSRFDPPTPAQASATRSGTLLRRKGSLQLI